MTDVIDFAAAKAERQPHWSGPVVCLGCAHEWVGVGPIGRHTGLTCPACSLPKGVVKYLFGCEVGEAQLSCKCGCEALTAFVRDGAVQVLCMACGTNLTGAFYG